MSFLTFAPGTGSRPPPTCPSLTPPPPPLSLCLLFSPSIDVGEGLLGGRPGGGQAAGGRRREPPSPHLLRGFFPRSLAAASRPSLRGSEKTQTSINQVFFFPSLKWTEGWGRRQKLGLLGGGGGGGCNRLLGSRAFGEARAGAPRGKCYKGLLGEPTPEHTHFPPIPPPFLWLLGFFFCTLGYGWRTGERRWM